MNDSDKTILGIKEILKMLPHRYPFLLVDKVVELEEGKRCVGIKNVTINEPFFVGHFPDHPVMPGVLIAECMAQVGAIMAMSLPDSSGKIVYYGGIDGMRFRKPVMPGDQLRVEAKVLWIRGVSGKLKVTAKVGDDVAAEGEILFALVDKDAKGQKIHQTAIVHPTAKVGDGVEIGPYVIIGPKVTIGSKTKIDAHTVIAKNATIGEENHICQNCVIASPPQDFKYKGEENYVEIGDRNTIREFVTIHLPTGEGSKTIVGSDNMIMIHAHIPHNARIGNNTVIGGYVGLGGHCVVDDYAIIGGVTAVHQLCRIGKLAMIGAGSKVVQDIPPFMLADGRPAEIRGINIIGLERRDTGSVAIGEIKKAFKILYHAKMNIEEATHEIKKKVRLVPEIEALVSFLEESTKRGINRKVSAETELIDESLILPEIPEIGI